MIASEEERKALVAQRGLAVLLAAGGLLLCWNGLGGEGFIARCGLGALMFAVGVGIFLYMRWARWMALGACFLIIASACIVPVMLLLVVPFEGDFDGSMRVNVLWSLVALAFGTIGYKGLAYFRSEAGRLEFAAENATAQRDLFNVAAPDRKDDLLGETSASVLVSAGVWVLVLLVAELLGLGRPDWLLAHKRPERPRVAPTVPQDLAWYEVSRDPASLVGNSSPAVKNRVLPDLIPLGICFRDVASGRVLDMVYANVGGGSGYQMFHFATRARSGEMPFRRQLELRVPEPDSLLITRLRDDVPSGTEYALVDLDVNNEISEADEINNSARFTISYNPDGGLDLPACNNVRLRIVPGTGPVRTVATTDAPPDLPDMVPLGLCARSNILVGLQFTNRGAYGHGLYQISQGHDGSDLRVIDRTYLSVPAPYEAMGFNVGVVSLLVGKRGKSANIMVKIDALDEIGESNEQNNVTSARVTRLADGSVDLPQCDELAKHASDPDWIDPGPVRVEPAAAKSAPEARPDLVPLGLCLSQTSSRKPMVVFGNAGTAANPRLFNFVASSAQGSMGERPPAGTFGPGALGTQFLNIDPKPGMIVELAIDPENYVEELNEANNTLSVEIRIRADGSVDLPDCLKGFNRVRNWMNMMESRKGNK